MQTLEQRQHIEKTIAFEVIECLLSMGGPVTVNDGEEDVYTGRDGEKILKAMFSTDQDFLLVKGGWVSLVYGSSGWDVISDYTTSLEEVITPANDLAKTLSAD